MILTLTLMMNYHEHDTYTYTNDDLPILELFVNRIFLLRNCLFLSLFFTPSSRKVAQINLHEQFRKINTEESVPSDKESDDKTEKISIFAKIGQKIQLGSHPKLIKMMKTAGIIHLLCFFLLPGMILRTETKTSFLGSLFFWTYIIVFLGISGFMINILIGHVLSWKNKWKHKKFKKKNSKLKKKFRPVKAFFFEEAVLKPLYNKIKKLFTPLDEIKGEMERDKSELSHKEALKKIHELNKKPSPKFFFPLIYGSKKEHKIIQAYNKKEGIPDYYLVNEKLTKVSVDDQNLELYLEKNHRDDFNTFFEKNLTLSGLLHYSSKINLIQIAKSRDNWLYIASSNQIRSTIVDGFSGVMEKMIKSILIFEYIENSYRQEFNNFKKLHHSKLLIPIQFDRNLIDLAQNIKIVDKNLKFRKVSNKDRKQFKILVRKIRRSCLLLRSMHVFELAQFEIQDNSKKEDNLMPKSQSKDENLPEKKTKKVKKIKKFKKPLVNRLLKIIPRLGLFVVSYLLIINPILKVDFLFNSNIQGYFFAAIFSIFITICIVKIIQFSKWILSKLLKKRGRFNSEPLAVKFHQHKLKIITFLSLFLCIAFGFTFIYAPELTYIPVLIFLGLSIPLLKKASKKVQKWINRKRRASNKGKNTFYLIIADSKKVKALLILIFLVFVPFSIFAVNSLVGIERPQYQFALAQQDGLSTSSYLNPLELQYHDDLDDLGTLNINSLFYIKCPISPNFGESAVVRVAIRPKDLSLPFSKYQVISDYVNGPLTDHELVTKVSLERFNLQPGKYDIIIHYGIRNGFAFRNAEVLSYTIELTKDHLSVISSSRFPEMELQTGGVYTFEYPEENCWRVVFDGTIVNSRGTPVALNEVSLFVEDNDKYEEIAIVNTDANGQFYHVHEIYGSMELNAMAKIAHDGTDKYQRLDHQEYCGLDYDGINDLPYFTDTDNNLYPDWPYTLEDLLLAVASSPQVPQTLAFLASFEEGSGTTTSDFVHDLSGTLIGNASWTTGAEGSALDFEGLVTEGSGGGASGPDFKVITGTTIISSSSATATITEGTDYDLEDGQDSSTCFIRITNTRLTGMGKTSGGGNQNLDDFTAWIQNPSNIATSITFQRTGTANDDRVTWEILQYTGPSKGANEMIIRDVGTATCSGTTSTCDGSSISTISDPDKVVVFITGQKAVDTGRGDWWESLFTAELTGSGPYSPRFTRGKSVSSNDGISYAVIEYTGSNWRDVQRLDISTECSTAWTTSNYATAYTDVTLASEGGVNLLDHTKTFIHQQYRTDSDATGLDDAGDNIEIINNTQLRIRNSATSANRYKTCWIIENTQSTGDVMSVEHNWFYKTAGGSEENTWTETITTVSNVDETSIFATATMDGTGTALPRGSIDFRLTADYTITFKESDNGQEKLVTYSVVQWPTAPSEGGSTFYENQDYAEFGDVLDSTLGINDDEFVISGWVKPDSLSSDTSENGIENCFFTKNGILEIGVNSSGYLQLFLNSTNIETNATYGALNSIPTGMWTFVAVRYNQSNVDILIDDTWYRSALGSSSEPWNNGGNLNSGGNVTIGAALGSPSTFDGKIDEISVFNITLTDADIEDHTKVLDISCLIKKEDGQGGWVPLISNGEEITGYINLEINSTGKDINTLELYLTTAEPNILNPTPQQWYQITTFSHSADTYSYVINSQDLSDNDTWYFVAKATDWADHELYAEDDTCFALYQLIEFLNLTYLDIDNRINYNNEIGVTLPENQEWHVSELQLFVNYSGDIDYLESFDNSELESYYWLVDLTSLSDWVDSKSLTPDEYDINFIIQANFSYSFGIPDVIKNYTMNDITLDIEGPEIVLLHNDPYTLVLGDTYDDLSENIVSMALNSSDDHFIKINLEYKYNTPTTSEWINYGSFDIEGNSTFIEITFNLLNLRDDNVSLQFKGYDDLGNMQLLTCNDYWIIKNMNNHLNFEVVGMDENKIHGIDASGFVNFSTTILPVDNDITSIKISTSYESFTLDQISFEQDHVYFAGDVDLNSNYYNVFGSDFKLIPISIKLYEGTTFITSKQLSLIVMTDSFDAPVEIVDLKINENAAQNNINMSFAVNANAYNNSHSIPFEVNAQPGLLKLYNSFGELVKTIEFRANNDSHDIETYDTGSIDIINNRFVVDLPNPVSGEVCSIERVVVNDTSYPYSYFVDQDQQKLYIILQSTPAINGTFGATGAIQVDYGISLSNLAADQFIASFDFSLLTQGEYTTIAEFHDISGQVSSYTYNETLFIDFHGPSIYKQFKSDSVINPKTGSISFTISDYSGVDSYWFNESIQGNWSIGGDSYVFYFNDSQLALGKTDLILYCNDTLDQTSSLSFSIYVDDGAPVISDVSTSGTTENDMFQLNFTISDNSWYEVILTFIHDATGNEFEGVYTLMQVVEDQWMVTFDVSQFENGYYNLSIIATDGGGNQATHLIGDLYFDHDISPIELIEEQVHVGSDNMYNLTITEYLYFNEEEYVFISALDEAVDGFDWATISQQVADQLGIKNITLFYTNPLAWYNLTLGSQLDYETFTYKITGYDTQADISKIKSIQKITIGGYDVKEFDILLDGTSLLLKIDPQYRYLLSSELSDEVQAQFYESISQGIELGFDDVSETWQLKSTNDEFFNISKYLTLEEGDEFLFNFEVLDGLENTLLTSPIKGIFDNEMSFSSQDSVFEWNLGTNSTGSGVLIFGSDTYSDSTVMINGSLVSPTIYNATDVNRRKCGNIFGMEMLYYPCLLRIIILKLTCLIGRVIT